jgi:hypothetical protein
MGACQDMRPVDQQWKRVSVIVLLATVVALSWRSNALAIDNHAKILLSQGSIPQQGAAASLLSQSEFQARWSGNREYTLTSSGAAVPSSPAESYDATLSSGYNQIGSVLGSLLGSIDFIKDKQIGNEHASDETSSTTLPAECGPSPLKPEEIRELVEGVARQHGVDPNLAVAVTAVESDFDRTRNSPKGARGPMQLMPATAARFDVSDPCDPGANIDGGVRYLRLLLDEFQNPLVAIAAYNAGENRIQQYGGIPPFAETVSYVAKVVNHQLGLPGPKYTKSGAVLAGERTDETSRRGVIVADKRRQWIAGVMQF